MSVNSSLFRSERMSAWMVVPDLLLVGGGDGGGDEGGDELFVMV